MESKIFPNLPIPVIRDKNGKLIKDYSAQDWINKLNEELDEVKFAIASDCDNKKNLVEELCDVIAVCTSYLEQLGYDQQKRGEFFADTNRKNLARGYIEPIKKETKPEEKTTESILEPAQVIRAAIAALQTISDDKLSEGQKLDIEEAMDHLKAAHDNDYDDEDDLFDVDDCITQLESLIDNSESFFNDDGDDEVWRDDVRYLEMAIKIIREWKALKVANVKDELPKFESIAIDKFQAATKTSTSSSKFKSIDNITVYEDGTVIINMVKK